MKTKSAELTDDEVLKTWLKEHVAIGTTLYIHNTQGSVPYFQKVSVTRLGKGRFEVSHPGFVGGTTFYYSGKNCYAPKGQTRIVVTTPEIEANYTK